jgi:soluble lytic murein transglycosylase-like protein
LYLLTIQDNEQQLKQKKFKRLKFVRKLSNYQLVNKLVTDVKFSALIAAHYLVWLRDTRKNYYHAISGYNGGYRNWRYYSRVKKKLRVVKKYVRRGVLH